MHRLSLCIPAPGSRLAHRLAAGSAVVTPCAPEDIPLPGDCQVHQKVDGHSPVSSSDKGSPAEQDVLIYFEGNLYDCDNLNSFGRKAVNAIGRMLERYPTTARTLVPVSELILVGTYDIEFKVIQLDRPDLVAAWEEGHGIFDPESREPASVRLVLDVDYELNGEYRENLVENLRAAIEREIGNGALTGESMAEVDSWTVTLS